MRVSEELCKVSSRDDVKVTIRMYRTYKLIKEILCLESSGDVVGDYPRYEIIIEN